MLKGIVIDDTALFNDKLTEWQDFYNYHRPPSDQRPQMSTMSVSSRAWMLTWT